MPSLRLGLVGCGYQGGCLAAAAARTTSVSFVACADPDAAAAERVAGLTPNAIIYPSVEALLSEAAVDAVIVAAPHHVLRALSIEAIRMGKHVLVEKPVGLNEQEAALLEAEAESAHVTVMAGYSCRFSLGQLVKDSARQWRRRRTRGDDGRFWFSAAARLAFIGRNWRRPLALPGLAPCGHASLVRRREPCRDCQPYPPHGHGSR